MVLRCTHVCAAASLVPDPVRRHACRSARVLCSIGDAAIAAGGAIRSGPADRDRSAPGATANPGTDDHREPAAPAVAARAAAATQDSAPVATYTNPPPPGLPGTGRAWMVTKTSQGCRAMVMNTGGCPPNAMCNPPPPHAYACIDGEKYPVKVVQPTAEVCQVEADPPPPCPRNAKCKPAPPPHVVPCPK